MIHRDELDPKAVKPTSLLPRAYNHHCTIVALPQVTGSFLLGLHHCEAGKTGFVPTLLGRAVGGVQVLGRAKPLLFEDVGGGRAFGGRRGSLGRAGCREVRAGGPRGLL